MDKERLLQKKMDQIGRSRRNRLRMSDKDIVQEAMLAHAMAILINGIRAGGDDIREDVWKAVNVEAVKALAGRNPVEVSRLANLIDTAVKDIFKDIRMTGPKQALLAWSYAVMKVVSEGLHPDPGCQAAVVALSLTDDARDSPEWAQDPIAVKLLGMRLFDRIQLAGYFIPVVQIDNLDVIT